MSAASCFGVRWASIFLALGLHFIVLQNAAAQQTISGNTTGGITIGSGNTVTIGGSSAGSTGTVPVCGTVTAFNQTAGSITLATATGSVTIAIPAGATINGTIPSTGDVYLLLSLTNGRITAIQVLPVAGATTTTGNVPAGTAIIVKGNYCSNITVTANNQGSSGTVTVTGGNCTCPAPSSAQNLAADPTQSPTAVVATAPEDEGYVHRVGRMLEF